MVEQGTHDELVQTPGLYATLWAIQTGETEQLPADLVDRFTRVRPTDG